MSCSTYLITEKEITHVAKRITDYSNWPSFDCVCKTAATTKRETSNGAIDGRTIALIEHSTTFELRYSIIHEHIPSHVYPVWSIIAVVMVLCKYIYCLEQCRC